MPAEAIEGIIAHVRERSMLTVHQQTLVALRVAALRDAPYAWDHLVSAAAEPPEVIVAVAAGAGEPGWSDLERARLQAVDELIAGATIEPRTRALLGEHFSAQEITDLVMTVGGYNGAALATKILGVPGNDLDSTN